ncbi:MAG: hypothetical protein RKP20_13860 [Candidatus Competibacter sp.]|nr:hypothetical protein [Candidatus Competibacter sp.]
MTTLLIEHLKARDLPPEWARRLQVRPEQTVTVRIDTETGAPAQPEQSFTTDDPAFGIWRDYAETADVTAFVRRLRAPRYRRDGSRQPD